MSHAGSYPVLVSHTVPRPRTIVAACLGLAVLLGVVSSILTAWIPAGIPLSKPGPFLRGGDALASERGWDYRYGKVVRLFRTEISVKAKQRSEGPIQGAPFPSISLPWWVPSSVVDESPLYVEEYPTVKLDGFGWPFVALSRHRLYSQGAGAEPWRSAIVLKPARFVNEFNPERYYYVDRALPTRPHLGLLLDSAIFALGWGALLWILLTRCPGPMRRLWRVSRGRCPVCAYDRTGLEGGRCPECGELSMSVWPRKRDRVVRDA